MARADDWLADTAERIRQAAAEQRMLCIRGGGSKDFYGNQPAAAAQGARLDTAGCAGVLDYQPRELTLTARAGTPLDEIEALLREQRQMLAFEPPHFGPAATLGGVVASGLAGPRRPYAGGVRDAVLGTGVLDGRGQRLRFGGRVLKNVAGYDVSRLLVGSLGTLGVLVEVTLKVLPRPDSECTLMLETPADEAIARMNRWAARPLPLSATAWRAGRLYVRLSGAASAVAAAARQLGGELVEDGAAFWRALREQTLPEFAARPLWRLSLPPTAQLGGLPEPPLIEWGGGVRWYAGALPAAELLARAHACGGHAVLFRSAAPARQAFAQPPPALAALQQRIRQALDPHGVFATGRM